MPRFLLGPAGQGEAVGAPEQRVREAAIGDCELLTSVSQLHQLQDAGTRFWLVQISNSACLTCCCHTNGTVLGLAVAVVRHLF